MSTLPPNITFRDSAFWLSTWFGCGMAARAPGTWGTLGGLPFGMFFIAVGGWPLLVAMIGIVGYFGFRAVERYEALTGEHDASRIVVDEVIGIWIALLGALSLSFIPVVLAFALFRLFDICKVGPVGWADRLPGAKGVMLDDVIAGIFAAAILMGLGYAGIL